MGQVKWATTNHQRPVTLCIWWDRKEVLLFMSSFWKTKQLIPSAAPNRSTESSTWQKASGISQQKTHHLLHKTACFFDEQAETCSLAGKFLIHPSYSPDIVPSDFHWFQSLQNSLNGKKASIPWNTVKGTCNSSLLKKIESFGKMELWSCLENDRR